MTIQLSALEGYGSRMAFDRAELAESTTVFASQKRAVRFQEVDAARTVYYARIFEYFGDVYIDFLAKAGIDVGRFLAEGRAAPLVHAEADYHHPLFFGSAIEVQVVRVRVGTSSLHIGYRIHTIDGKLAVTGSTSHVFVDTATFKPMPIPQELRTVTAQT